MKASDLRIKIFADGAQLETMKDQARNPLISGFTTNPSLIKAAGGKLPDHAVDGLDLRAFLSGSTLRSPRREFFYYFGRRLRGVRLGEWKLLLGDDKELYNLELDPSERYNRAAEKPELVEQLTKRVEEMVKEVSTGVAKRN